MSTLTDAQTEAINHLNGDVAHSWTEKGSFRTAGGFESRSRLRINTYSLHGHGVLILNEDGTLWADDGATQLLPTI